MPPSFSRDLLIADGALTFLPPPQPAKLATSFERLVHPLCKPFGKVAVVRWIVRIRFSLDLGVWPFPVFHQVGQQLVLVRKSPVAPLEALEVTLFDPPLSLVRVTAARPTPQCLPDLMIASCKRPGCHLTSMIICPPPDYRGKFFYHLNLSGSLPFAQQAADFPQKRLDILFRYRR